MNADNLDNLRIFPLWAKFFIITLGLILIISLSTNLTTSRLFSTELSFQMHESGLNLARSMASEMEGQISGLLQRTAAFFTLAGKLPSETLRQEAAEALFSSDGTMLYIASGTAAFTNTKLTAEHNIDNPNLAAYAGMAMAGAIPKYNRPVIQNISPVFDRPMLLIRYSAGADAPTLMIIMLADELRAALAGKSNEINGSWTTTLLLDMEGNILLHPDPVINNSAANFSSLPIWQEAMRNNAVSNLQRSFRYEDTVYWGNLYKSGLFDIVSLAAKPLNLSLAAVKTLNLINIYIIGMVLSASLLTVYLFATHLTRPIGALVKATRHISEGNYTISLPPAGRDEIGILSRSFEHMTTGLVERERIKTAFGRFVNKDLAEKALKNDIHLGGEIRQAAILFTDIRSFTSMSEQMTPAELIEFLNDYMGRMVTCVNATGGTVDKFIGDAIMAVWGLRDNMGNVVKGAVDAALLMRETLVSYNLKRASMGQPPIKIGCGISYGPVVAGQMGSADRMEYTVIGDTVNVASRTESLTKNFGVDILITEEAYNQVSKLYLFKPLEKLHIRGKAEKQQLYVVEARLKNNFESLSKNISELRLRLSSTLKNTETPTEERDI